MGSGSWGEAAGQPAGGAQTTPGWDPTARELQENAGQEAEGVHQVLRPPEHTDRR